MHYKSIYMEQDKENKCIVELIVMLVKPHPLIFLAISHMGASNNTIIFAMGEQPNSQGERVAFMNQV